MVELIPAIDSLFPGIGRLRVGAVDQTLLGYGIASNIALMTEVGRASAENNI